MFGTRLVERLLKMIELKVMDGLVHFKFYPFVIYTYFICGWLQEPVSSLAAEYQSGSGILLEKIKVAYCFCKYI